MDKEEIKQRLEYLRTELREERISYGELAELQGLAPHIDPDDLELREAAGVPENIEWTAYPERGGSFALINGVLHVVPLDENGTMDASDPIEVDYNGIDPEDAEACRKIEAELKAKQQGYMHNGAFYPAKDWDLKA